MKHINVTQGSEAWLKLRKDFFTASEAPMMMGDHKNISRNQLLDAKKGWTTIVDEYLQKLFDKGHATEEAARPLAAADVGEDLFPVTGSLEVEGLALLASFDGLTMFDDVCFEHKLFNKTLAENVLNNVLEPHYYWQLEQQLLVSGADKCYFVTSDGTKDNWQAMYYVSVPERREALIKGWKQFAIDLEIHEPQAKASKGDLVPEEVPLPTLKCTTSGSLVSSNLPECIDKLKAIKEDHFDVKVETEQGLADRLALINNVNSTRKKLKDKVEEIKGEFVSLADFEALAKQADSVLQKLHSNAKKMAEDYKSARNGRIISEANSEVISTKNKAEGEINAKLPDIDFNPAGAMKGKRTIESLQDAADTEVAKAKIQINEFVELAMGNALHLSTQAQGYDFLFNDWAQIAFKATEDFKTLVTARIANYQAEQKAKEDAERERIRQEEQAKLQREAEAKARAEEQAKRDAEEKESYTAGYEQYKNNSNQLAQEAPTHEPKEEVQPEPQTKPAPSVVRQEQAPTRQYSVMELNAMDQLAKLVEEANKPYASDLREFVESVKANNLKKVA